MRYIHFQRIGNLSRLAANLNLTNDLLQYALFLFDADRLTNQVKRHSNIDLLPFNQPGEIRMNQTALDRIDLSLVKHHFADSDPFNIDREDRVSSGIRAKDRSQFSKRSDGGDSSRATAINRNGHHAIAP